MNKQVLLIVNPNAGKGKIQKKIPEIKQDLIKTGYNVEILTTQKNLSAEDIIKKYDKKVEVIICCGGDGTVNDMINGVMKLEDKPEVSFIPLGTVNDFAKTIGLSKIRFLLPDILKRYSKKKSDIGSFNDKFFSYVAAFGAFTPVSYVTSQKLKRYLGKFAYFIVGVKYLFKNNIFSSSILFFVFISVDADSPSPS